MKFSDIVWQEEKAYLEHTLTMIKSQIQACGDKAENYKENIVKAQKSMWEERSVQANPSTEIDGAAIAWQHQSYMINEAKSMTFFSEMREKLQRMEKSPYFARIDFDESEEGLESYYIGMGKLAEDDFSNIQIYDWRSPVCSMFYNYEIGPASYECPVGEITGQLTLKRQYKIGDALIQFMFDSGLKINDEMLQEILGKSTDDKMKTIVTSIQKEQNQLIRDESHQVLMIQGSAGSGKTSIALHRIAYILYRHRHHLNAKNMVIFSPNEIFNDYISDVLPELGEENVKLTTFNDYLATILPNARIEDWNNQMEHLLLRGGNNNLRKESIIFKTSDAFVEVLKAYVTYLKDEGLGFKDIRIGDEMVMSAKALLNMYRENQEVLSPKQSLNRIRLRLHKSLDPLISAKKKELRQSYERSSETFFDEEMHEKLNVDIREEFREVRSLINKMTRFDVKWLYKALFKQLCLQKKVNNGKAICHKGLADYTIRHMESGYLFYEDALAVAWLKGALEGAVRTSDIKHVVIDEAQDYSRVHYEIFNQLFPKAEFTLLGDVNQSINPYLRMGDYSKISDVFKSKTLARVTLQRSYRSSKQIAAFCSGLLPFVDQTIYLERQGSEPRIIDCVDESALIVEVNNRVGAYCAQRYKSIAIICKTEKSSERLFNQLDETLGAHMITRQEIHYKKGVVVVPSYLAKGLEFDVVMVCAHGYNNYSHENERNLFYTVCSRALHELEVLYTGEKPIFV